MAGCVPASKQSSLSLAALCTSTPTPRLPFHCQGLLAFLIACRKPWAGHMLVRVEDDRHDVPGGGEGWRARLPAEPSQQVPLVPRGSIVDLQEVEATAVVIFQVKGVESEQEGRALSCHNQPAAFRVVGVQPREVGAGEVSRRCREHSPTLDTWSKREDT